MARVISGKELSAKLKAGMAEQVKTFPEKYGRVPHLAVVLVGEDPASQSYVKGKAKASAEVGIKNTTILRPADISEDDLLKLIGELNLPRQHSGYITARLYIFPIYPVQTLSPCLRI